MHGQFPAVARATRGVVLACLGVLACGESRGGEQLAVLGEPVVHGEVSPAGTREDAVLLLRTELDGDELICSASLVAENLVITARHCVSHLARGIFSCTAQGKLVSLDEGAGQLGTHLDASKLEFYDGTTPRSEPVAFGKEVISTLSETICMNDLAFVVLDRNVELPLLPFRESGPAERGEPVTLVGYGLDEAMSQTGRLDVKTQRRTRNAELVVADLGPAVAGSQLSTVPPRSLLVVGPAGCLGDSGGPLLARETGAVLGVYSLLGAESCLDAQAHHLFVHVPLFSLLVEQAFAASGGAPTPEPTPTQNGEGGGAGERAGNEGGVSGERGAQEGGAAGNAATGSNAGGTSGRGAGGEGGDAPATTGGAGVGAGARPGDVDAGTPGLAPQPRHPKDGGCGVASPARRPAASALLLALAVCWLARGRRRGALNAD